MNVNAKKERVIMKTWRNDIMQMQRKNGTRYGRSGKRAMEGVQGHEIVYEGKLICAQTGAQFTATLTADLFLWKSSSFKLEDIIAVSCIDVSCQLLIHTYTTLRTRWVPALFGIARRRHCCFNFFVQNSDRLAEWKMALAEQGCHLAGTKGSTSNAIDSVPDIKRSLQPTKFMLVILNPCSGHGRACKIYHDKVEPVFKLAGLRCEVIETTAPHHAQALVSSFNSYSLPDVLELSSKYQRFGPLRYFIAGAIKMFNLRGYECEIQYLPATGPAVSSSNHDSTSSGTIKEAILHRPELDKKGHWKSKKGIFLGITLCNHQCKTVQCMRTQKLAPSAKHDDGLLDLLLVHKIGCFQLLQFLMSMQYGHHISLPFVEYLKVLGFRYRYRCARWKINALSHGRPRDLVICLFLGLNPSYLSSVFWISREMGLQNYWTLAVKLGLWNKECSVWMGLDSSLNLLEVTHEHRGDGDLFWHILIMDGTCVSNVLMEQLGFLFCSQCGTMQKYMGSLSQALEQRTKGSNVAGTSDSEVETT